MSFSFGVSGGSFRVGGGDLDFDLAFTRTSDTPPVPNVAGVIPTPTDDCDDGLTPLVIAACRLASFAMSSADLLFATPGAMFASLPVLPWISLTASVLFC